MPRCRSIAWYDFNGVIYVSIGDGSYFTPREEFFDSDYIPIALKKLYDSIYGGS